MAREMTEWTKQFFERLADAKDEVKGRWICPLCGASMELVEGDSYCGQRTDYDLECSQCSLKYPAVVRFDPLQDEGKDLDIIFADFDELLDTRWTWFRGANGLLAGDIAAVMRGGGITAVDIVDALLSLEQVGCGQRQALADYLGGGMLDCAPEEDGDES